jgi:hypothetical protein
MTRRTAELTKDALPILEQFAPEPGYALEHLLCLSYSLNPAVASALLMLCLPDIGKEFAEIDTSRLKKDDIGRAVKGIIPRSIFVINGHDSIQGVDKMREFEHLIMHHVEKAGSRLSRSGSLRGSFHPKLLLAIYRPRWDTRLPLYGKCYIGSRNFTLDLAQEFGTVLPLVVNSPYKRFTTGLSNFLNQAVIGEVKKTSSVTKIKEIANLINKLRFGPPRLIGVEDVGFHWQDRRNPASYLWPKLYQRFKHADSIGIVSPWLSRQQCKRLNDLKGCKEFKVRCLGTETHALNDFTTKPPSRLDLAIGSEYSIYALGEADKNREIEPPLHMKYYFANTGRKQVLFFGSANFTTSGLGPSSLLNTEILAQYDLKSKPYSLSGFPFESEDQSEEKTDSDKLLHQEWLDALEITWCDFRETLKLDLPLFKLTMNPWHELTIEGFTTSPQKVDDFSENEEGLKSFSQAESEIWKSLFLIGVYKPDKIGFASKLNATIPEHVKDSDLSPLIRISLRWKRDHSVVTTKIVPIPEDILDAIRKSRMLPAGLKMTTVDYLESLAEMIDNVSGATSIKQGKGRSKSYLERLIASITLDRFVYRMAMLRDTKPDHYRSGLERAREILSEMNELEVKNHPESKLLDEFKVALQSVLEHLGESQV